jgi:hypothetical protein
MRHIVRVEVTKMTETCERTTFYVQLTTDEGFSITPASYRTGSVYEPGLELAEARDRALIDAGTWADLLEIKVEPFVDDGVTYEQSMNMEIYTTRRILEARSLEKKAMR